MTERDTAIRYPRRFEIFRLEALGDDPYFSLAEAERRYDDGRGLSVVPDGRPPAWYLDVSAKGYRFTITFYARSSTPITVASWEHEGAGLLCRRTVDLFYPDGDPGRKVPYAGIVTVTQSISTDGVIGITTTSPIAPSEYREVTDAPRARHRLSFPSFGNWAGLEAASAPQLMDRFGIAALDEAFSYATRLQDQGSPRDFSNVEAGWRIRVGGDDVASAVASLADDRAPSVKVPVLDRGRARIIPLAVQAAAGHGREPAEERRRTEDLATSVVDAMEHREGRGIPLDLAPDVSHPFANALRIAGVSRAVWWRWGTSSAVVLVWSGDEEAHTLSLALYVVPADWLREQPGRSVESLDVRWSRDEAAAFPAGSQS